MSPAPFGVVFGLLVSNKQWFGVFYVATNNCSKCKWETANYPTPATVPVAPE